jgi:hypothetical protein
MIGVNMNGNNWTLSPPLEMILWRIGIWPDSVYVDV